jgi:CubicO group peptidase (beta-lactamase class C family)
MWQRIFQPLALVDTSFPTSDPYVRGRHVRDYMKPGPQEPYLDCTEFSPSEAWPAGAANSTRVEMARFLDALLGGQLLSERSLAAMCATRLMDEPARGCRSGRSYGYGLARRDLLRSRRRVTASASVAVPCVPTAAAPWSSSRTALTSRPEVSPAATRLPAQRSDYREVGAVSRPPANHSWRVAPLGHR